MHSAEAVVYNLTETHNRYCEAEFEIGAGRGHGWGKRVVNLTWGVEIDGTVFGRVLEDCELGFEFEVGALRRVLESSVFPEIWVSKDLMKIARMSTAWGVVHQLPLMEAVDHGEDPNPLMRAEDRSCPQQASRAVMELFAMLQPSIWEQWKEKIQMVRREIEAESCYRWVEAYIATAIHACACCMKMIQRTTPAILGADSPKKL